MDFSQQMLYEGLGTDQTTYEELRQLTKALQANEGITDIQNLRGFPSLQPQSLEGTLAMLTWSDQHLVMWKDIPKSGARSTLEEYNTQSGYGQEGGYVGQMENPLEGDFVAQRNFALVKFIRSMWKVSDVSGMVQSTPSSAEVVNKTAATRRVMRTFEKSIFTGDSDIIPDSIDGIEKTIRTQTTADHVIDLRGGNVSQEVLTNAAELVYANFGNVDNCNLYGSPGGMNAISQILKSNASGTAQRVIQSTVGADGQISVGYGVNRVLTPFGNYGIKNAIMLASEYEGFTIPLVPQNGNAQALIEAKTSERSPETPTVAAAPTGVANPNSKWLSTGESRVAGVAHRYIVLPVNKYGLGVGSAIAVSSGPTVAGQGVAVTITPNPNGAWPASGFVILAEDGTPGTGTDLAARKRFRKIGYVAANGTNAVTFTDLNATIPGTTKMFLVDMTSQGDNRVLSCSQLAPIYSKELAPIGMYRWGIVNFYMAMKYYAPLRMVMLENVPVTVQSTSPLLNI